MVFSPRSLLESEIPSEMTVRAESDKKFIRRFLYISIGSFLFMLWGLYDGLYTKPNEMVRAIEYKKLVEQRDSGEITEAQRAERWNELVEEKKWDRAKPKGIKEVQNDIYFQWFVFAVGLILGIFFLLKYLRLLRSWIQADESGVTTSWGESLTFDKIEKIDKRKWEKKGIARVSYAGDNGNSKTMIFDDFKYDRSPMGQILELAERDLKDEMIVGGRRESERSSVEELVPDSSADAE